MFPLANLIELAASAVPEINVVPVTVDDVKAVNPAIVEAVAPKLTDVLPIVKEELAN